MQPIASFNANLGTAIGLVGPAGSGKTVLGMRLFPRTAVIVLDLNFESGRRYLEKIGKLDNIAGFDTVTVENDKPVKPSLWYDRFFKIAADMIANPDVDALFIDGATQITECIIAKLVCANTTADIQIGARKDAIPLWGTLGVTWRGLLTQMRQSGKKIVLAIHEQKNKDESDQMWKHELLIPGQTKDTLPNLMSDVWRTFVDKEGADWVWKVQTLPVPFKIEFLKNTYGLPGVMKADELVKQVQAQSK